MIEPRHLTPVQFCFRLNVHTELLTSDFNEFRKHASDHLPITVQIKVAADDD